jgi:hypothetical protein
VRYDRAVTAAMVAGGSVVDDETRSGDDTDAGAAADLRALWLRTREELENLTREESIDSE